MSIEVNEVQTAGVRTESDAAIDLAGKIIGDITRVNEQLVAEQYRLNSDVVLINKILEDSQVESAYLMSLLKAVNIITGNIIATPDIPDSERITAIVGMQVSVAVLLREKLASLPQEDVVPTIAALSNLLTLVEIPNSDEETTLSTAEL